ncbi:endonuclease/exonuclease/phosphatase family protein [Psychromonas sp. KJ10-10]|uniref:endonuclease/exonuclease/phosphatase family protein n=1 Tax=Psychromonas sp. KJ10-10 TaxID=3391823 RepID=UPI0039B4C7F4
MAKQQKHKPFGVLNALIYFINVLILAVVICSYMPIHYGYWWLDNLLSLKLQWALVALLMLAVNFFIIRKALIFSLLTCLMLSYPPLSQFVNNTQAHETTQLLNIAQLNLRYQNPDIEQLLERLNSSEYDLLALQEASDNWHRQIQSLSKSYPYSVGTSDSSPSPSGLVLFSRWPIVEHQLHFLGYRGGHVIEAIIQSPETSTPVQVFALHPVSPRNAELWQLRNKELNSVAQLVANSSLQYKIIIGDLNTSPWSWQFKRLQNQSLLSNTSNLFGYIPSWSYRQDNPLITWLSSAYIDHCLISDDFILIDKSQEQIRGTDHLLITTLLGMPE